MDEYITLMGSLIAVTAIVSLSGVMMPGPVFAASIAKGYKDRHAGLWIGIGHGMIELPLIILIGFGLGIYLNNLYVALIIGIAGGSMLMFMGLSMFDMRKDTKEYEQYLPQRPTVVGIVMTAVNPYWFIWWATVGATMIIFALTLGILGLAVFAVVHISCDIGFDYFVSYSANRSKKFWKRRTHEYVFGACGVLMYGFGIFFVGKPIIDYITL
jgi:threonine/homoserine/homoserine lactone efflux protein